MYYSDTPTAASELFPAEALPANRAGQLSEDQLRELKGEARSWRGKFAWGGALGLIAGVVVVVAGLTSKHHDFWAVLIGIVIAVVGLVLLGKAMTGTDALTEDVREGQVKVLDGATLKWALPSSSGNPGAQPGYYIQVADQRFWVPQEVYRAWPEAGNVRVFYLPRSKHIVNLEQLADAPLPAGTLTTWDMINATKGFIFTHGAENRAEAAADLVAMRKHFDEQAEATRHPAVDDAAGRPPLPQAILGTWVMGPLQMSFAADGTATVTFRHGKRIAGGWTADAGGHLQIDWSGHHEDTQARVDGDTLTIARPDGAVTLKRLA